MWDPPRFRPKTAQIGVEAYADTEHFGVEYEVGCECGVLFEPRRSDLIIEYFFNNGVTYSCCCPRCGDEVLYDIVDERSQMF